MSEHYDNMADEEKKELADHIRMGTESAYQTLLRGLTDEQLELLNQVEADIRQDERSLK